MNGGQVSLQLDSAQVHFVEFLLVFDPLALNYEKEAPFPSSSCTQTVLVNHNVRPSIPMRGLNIASLCGKILAQYGVPHAARLSLFLSCVVVINLALDRRGLKKLCHSVSMVYKGVRGAQIRVTHLGSRYLLLLMAHLEIS